MGGGGGVARLHSGKSASQTRPWFGPSERCGCPAPRSLWEAERAVLLKEEGVGFRADPCSRRGQEGEGLGWAFQRGTRQEAQGRLGRGLVGEEPGWQGGWCGQEAGAWKVRAKLAGAVERAGAAVGSTT